MKQSEKDRLEELERFWVIKISLAKELRPAVGDCMPLCRLKAEQ